MRLTVPHWIGRWNRSGFPPEFWEEMSQTQPHIFVVDECSPRRTEQYSKFARGVRDMLNWFMVFNDIRSQGDGSAYESESTLPAHHFPELRKWYEYVITKRDMQHYVGPGATYRIRHWAPELKPEVLMGDMVVPSRPAETGDNAPTVVLANPAIYRTEGDDLPEPLKALAPTSSTTQSTGCESRSCRGSVRTVSRHGSSGRQRTSTSSRRGCRSRRKSPRCWTGRSRWHEDHAGRRLRDRDR